MSALERKAVAVTIAVVTTSHLVSERCSDTIKIVIVRVESNGNRMRSGCRHNSTNRSTTAKYLPGTKVLIAILELHRAVNGAVGECSCK